MKKTPSELEQLCSSALLGRRCGDDLCSMGETLCGFDDDMISDLGLDEGQDFHYHQETDDDEEDDS